MEEAKTDVTYLGAFKIYTPKKDIANVKNPDLNIFTIFSFWIFSFKLINSTVFLVSYNIKTAMFTIIIVIDANIIFLVIKSIIKNNIIDISINSLIIWL